MRTREEIEASLHKCIMASRSQETVISLELGTIREVLLDIRDLIKSEEKENLKD